ncbi:hypothetical protein [Streptacidiphilus rugosus]|uniref:hypothetical protein n=1 Tax=Streptacidiphilus rugosus TaxID=405783 RepID=UPI00068A6712|nr:hypothetical protein [Streptacidiphilus rugosus]
MTTSAISAAVDYLVTAATTAYGTSAHVFDGPPATDTALDLDDRIWIGFDPVNEGVPAVTGDQEFAALGARSRNETFEIVCAVEHWSGDSTFRGLRDGAFALLAQVEMLLRGTGGQPGDCTLGGAVLYAQVSGGIELHQSSTANGAAVLVLFHISCRARLTS